MLVMFWTVCWLSVLKADEVSFNEEARVLPSWTTVACAELPDGSFARVDQSCQYWVNWLEIPLLEGSGKFCWTAWRPLCCALSTPWLPCSV